MLAVVYMCVIYLQIYQAWSTTKKIIKQVSCLIFLKRSTRSACWQECWFRYIEHLCGIEFGCWWSEGRNTGLVLHLSQVQRCPSTTLTYSHLVKVVLVDGSANGGPPLSFVNGLWLDQSTTLRPNYRDIMKNQYRGIGNASSFTKCGWSNSK